MLDNFLKEGSTDSTYITHFTVNNPLQSGSLLVAYHLLYVYFEDILKRQVIIFICIQQDIE
jgi:hypothetical protein